jgi:hypothetical protein
LLKIQTHFVRAKKDGVFIFEEVDFDLQDLTKLLIGRIDGFAMEIDVAKSLIK